MLLAKSTDGDALRFVYTNIKRLLSLQAELKMQDVKNVLVHNLSVCTTDSVNFV